MTTLGISATDPDRFTWEPVAPSDPDHMPHARRLMHIVADRIAWKQALDEARRRTAGQPDSGLSAIGRVA